MPKPLSKNLQNLQKKVEKAAKEYGLDFFPTFYETIDYDEMNMIAAYGGFPVRYPHWRFGMHYEKLSKTYEYGMGRIYELVINHNPCYAYLLESNAEIDQKLVMCHVIGHNDFFKNNYTFMQTDRRMIDQMANHATRIRRYMDWYGVEEVENFIDKVLSLENLIDYQSAYMKRADMKNIEEVDYKRQDILKIPFEKEYMENYVNPPAFVENQIKAQIQISKGKEKIPSEPTRDVLLFLMNYGALNRWQQDVMGMLREEAYYFAPQAMTKIMNEGWASYWHSTLMTQKLMKPADLIDYADRHSGVVHMAPGGLNPYKLGLELFRNIEERWNKGQFGKEWDECEKMDVRRAWDLKTNLGREKIFQVRKMYSDITFLDEFFTQDFCKMHGFFTTQFDSKKNEYVIDSRDFKVVKKRLLDSLTNLGTPMIQVLDSNYENRSELLLEHVHFGQDLEGKYLNATLGNLASLWGRSVHLKTAFEEKPLLLTFDYKENRLKEQQL